MKYIPFPYKWMRREIAQLNPAKDAPRIIQLYISNSLPQSALLNNLIYTLGLVRLCASREQSIPVHRNGRGKVYRKGDQRADETNFHLFMWIENDIDDAKVKTSLAHVKALHDRIGQSWPMRQEAFLHALSSFTLLLERFQTRVLGLAPLGDTERQALLHQFQRIGAELGIDNIPQCWEAMEACLDNYEQSEQVGYSVEGSAVANALIDQFLSRWLPLKIYPTGRIFITALLEEHIVEALNLPHPHPLVKRSIRSSVRTALLVKRHILPDPREPFRLSDVTVNNSKSALPQPG